MGMPSGISLFIISLFMIMPLVMLVNVAISEFKDNINKIVWIIIILVLYPIGWILYLIFGRKQRVKKGENSENKLIKFIVYNYIINNFNRLL